MYQMIGQTVICYIKYCLIKCNTNCQITNKNYRQITNENYRQITNENYRQITNKYPKTKHQRIYVYLKNKRHATILNHVVPSEIILAIFPSPMLYTASENTQKSY